MGRQLAPHKNKTPNPMRAIRFLCHALAQAHSSSCHSKQLNSVSGPETGVNLIQDATRPCQKPTESVVVVIALCALHIA